MASGELLRSVAPVPSESHTLQRWTGHAAVQVDQWIPSPWTLGRPGPTCNILPPEELTWELA